jgi:hypothetical protein
VRECKAALVDQGRNISARNHDDLLTAVHLLEDERTEDDVRQKLRQTLTRQRLLEEEQQMLNGTIRLAARLLLMVNIGSMPSEVCGKLAVEWLEGSLQEAVYSHFNTPPDTTADPKHEIVGSDLTCRYIEHVAGIEIVPTDNLADHLRLVDKDKKLCMFHHVTVLRRMKAVRWYVVSCVWRARMADLDDIQRNVSGRIHRRDVGHAHSVVARYRSED